MKDLTQEEIEEIRKNPDKVDWNYISWKQKLSEGFIREFSDKVYSDGAIVRASNGPVVMVDNPRGMWDEYILLSIFY